MTVVAGPRELPPLEANRELVVPTGVERTLGNGLTVIVIERRSVPLRRSDQILVEATGGMRLPAARSWKVPVFEPAQPSARTVFQLGTAC